MITQEWHLDLLGIPRTRKTDTEPPKKEPTVELKPRKIVLEDD